MRYKPQPKGEIDSQIFSFCLTDKILAHLGFAWVV